MSAMGWVMCAVRRATALHRVARFLFSPRCAALLGLAVLLPGCLSARVKLSELPSQPIAITFWEPLEARRRADIISQAKAQPGRQRAGVARIENLGAVLGVYDPRRESPGLAKYPGYLALVYPQTGEVERLGAARPGSRPLTWSADRKRLLFASSAERDTVDLFEYELESGLVRRLTFGDGSPLVGAYGPDRRLVYASLERRGRQTRMSIYLTGPHGASPELLSQGVTTDGLAWSPLGTPVLYVRRDVQRSKPRPVIVAMDPVRGAKQVELGPGRDPVFTPDGEWIVYSGPVGDGWRLRRMRPDGSGRTRVGKGRRDEVQPAVSPDSSYVAYIGRDVSDPVDRLYVRRIDGTGDRILIQSGGASSPAW